MKTFVFITLACLLSNFSAAASSAQAADRRGQLAQAQAIKANQLQHSLLEQSLMQSALHQGHYQLFSGQAGATATLTPSIPPRQIHPPSEIAKDIQFKNSPIPPDGKPNPHIGCLASRCVIKVKTSDLSG